MKNIINDYTNPLWFSLFKRVDKANNVDVKYGLILPVVIAVITLGAVVFTSWYLIY